MITLKSVFFISVVVSAGLFESQSIQQLPLCGSPRGEGLNESDLMVALTIGCIRPKPPYMECEDVNSECVEPEICLDSVLDTSVSGPTNHSDAHPLSHFDSDFVCCRNVNEISRRIHRSEVETNEISDAFSDDGSTEAKYGEFPWMAIVGRIINDTFIQYLSGGVLIHRRIVLTTAHMIEYNAGLPTLAVTLGQLDIPDQNHTIMIAVRDSYINPEYNNISRANNVAMLVLRSAVPIGNINIAPVAIPERYTSCFTSQCFVSGWGLNSDNVALHHLQKISANIIPKHSCKHYLKDSSKTQSVSNKNLYINPDSICLETVYDGADVCIGFQGSPLVCRKTKGTNESALVGIVSDNVDCRNRSRPVMLVDIRTHLKWINQILIDVDNYEMVMSGRTSHQSAIPSINIIMLLITITYYVLFRVLDFLM